MRTRSSVPTRPHVVLRRFTSRVLRREGDPSPSLVLAWPERVERIQRREHVRVEVRIPVEVRVHEAGETPRILPAVSANLSTGGMRLNFRESAPDGIPLGLVVRLPGFGEVECEGQVVHMGTDERATGEMKHWTVEFTRISEPVRKQITQFLFEVQREQRRKGVA